MGITETARAKAQAAVSKAEAEVTRISAELNQAKRQLASTDSAGDVLDSVKEVAVLGPLTSGIRDQVDVDQAQQRAEVDRLAAELRVAQDKLDLARKAQDALIAVVGE